MDELKYYFVSYWHKPQQSRSPTWANQSSPSPTKWEPKNILLAEHPLQWQIKKNKYASYTEKYSLISWKEITQQEFEHFSVQIAETH